MSCVGSWASDTAAHIEFLSESADRITGLYGRGSVESERAINAYVMALHKLIAARTAHDDRVWQERLQEDRAHQRDELQRLIDRAHQRQSVAA
jgi:hypothetical protein